jgi:hypothetical protein
MGKIGDLVSDGLIAMNYGLQDENLFSKFNFLQTVHFHSGEKIASKG